MHNVGVLIVLRSEVFRCEGIFEYEGINKEGGADNDYQGAI